MRRLLVAALLMLALQPWLAETLHGFCGFYVSKADTAIFNRASQVVLVRDRDRTVLTMANDFKGAPTEFAVVIPVPTFIRREQIHVADKTLIDHLDGYAEAAIRDGKLHPFKCPVVAQDGKQVECKGGANLDDGQILGMNFYVKGVDDKIPGK